MVANGRAHIVRIFTDTAGENNRVQSAHDRHVTAYVANDAVNLHASCELRTLVALSRRGFDVAVIRRKTRNAENTGLFVEQFVHFVGRFVFFFHDVKHSRRVNGAGTCAHDFAVQRGKTHGGVQNLAVFHGGNRRTVAQVAGDEFQFLQRAAHDFGAAVAYKAVGSAVEAVFTDFVFFIVFIGEREHIRFRRHGRVERVVEHRDLRHVRPEQRNTCLNAFNVRRIV